MLNAYRVLAIALVFTSCGPTRAAEPKQSTDAKVKEEKLPPQEVIVADGHLVLSVPGDWKQVEPRSRIVEIEFSIPEAEEGVGSGRMTIMASGGSIEDNLARWIGQFRTAEGKPLEGAEPVEHEAGDLKITTLDLSGTYRDMPRGPFGPAVELTDHRMIGAIIPTDAEGTYYVKLYGPLATIDKVAENFFEMMKGIQWK